MSGCYRQWKRKIENKQRAEVNHINRWFLIQFKIAKQLICPFILSLYFEKDLLDNIATKQHQVEELQQQRAALNTTSSSSQQDPDLEALTAGIQDLTETAEELLATRTQWLEDAERYDEAKTEVEKLLDGVKENLEGLEKDDLMSTREKLEKYKVRGSFYVR